MSYYKPNTTTQSVHIWYDPVRNITANKPMGTGWLHFASQFEFGVYQQLSNFLKIEKQGLELITQRVLCIKPPSRSLGQLNWKVDFMIRDTASLEEFAYIEAKGGWLLKNTLYENEFFQKLHMWDSFYPGEFSKFYLVGDKSLQRQSNFPIKVWDANELIKELREVL